MDEPRSIKVHQSLFRPEMAMGGEREPTLITVLICLVLIVSSIAYKFYFIAAITVLLFFGALFALRKMAKADPLMTKVWRQRMSYQEFYSARTSVWCDRHILK